jgi:hypothetical protein
MAQAHRQTVHPAQVQPTLRAILHAIFFHRLLDNLEPETIEIADTHIASINSPALDKEVNARIEEFCREYVDKGASTGEVGLGVYELWHWQAGASSPPCSSPRPGGLIIAHLQLAVVFLQRKPRKGWFAITEVSMVDHLGMRSSGLTSVGADPVGRTSRDAQLSSCSLWSGDTPQPTPYGSLAASHFLRQQQIQRTPLERHRTSSASDPRWP